MVIFSNILKAMKNNQSLLAHLINLFKMKLLRFLQFVANQNNKIDQITHISSRFSRIPLQYKHGVIATLK